MNDLGQRRRLTLREGGLPGALNLDQKSVLMCCSRDLQAERPTVEIQVAKRQRRNRIPLAVLDIDSRTGRCEKESSGSDSPAKPKRNLEHSVVSRLMMTSTPFSSSVLSMKPFGPQRSRAEAMRLGYSSSAIVVCKARMKPA